jgi:hypothetical protein
MLNCKLLSTQAADLKDLFLNYMYVMEVTNSQTRQNTSQNSVLWRGAKCHGQISRIKQQ